MMNNIAADNDAAARRVPTIGYFDKLGVVLTVLLPSIAKGVLQRRRSMMAIGQRFDIDKRAIRRLQQVRAKYGDGPLMLSILGRKHVLVLEKNDLARVLTHDAASFSPASDEKKSALGHFEPHVSLISKGAARAERRQFNHDALESRCPNHSFAARFTQVASEEVSALLAYSGPRLTWKTFSPVWDRIVRRVVLGDAARDDAYLSELLSDLRGDGNWSFLKPRNTAKREEFRRLLEHHLARAEPQSLAAAVAQEQASPGTAPCSQATHWMFAFDAGAIATVNALAMLALHPHMQDRAVAEARGAAGASIAAGCPADGVSTAAPAPIALPYLRSCVLESLRLWPTTMIVHRKSTQETKWDNGVIPQGLSVLLFAPYFHRNDAGNVHAHTFAPDIWLDDPGGTKLPFIPFSAGQGICPGRHIVLLTAAATLAALLRNRTVHLSGEHPFTTAAELPGTLNHFDLAFDIPARERAAAAPAGNAEPHVPA
jgi:cytochrome P450